MPPVAFVGGNTLRGLNYAVVNPMTKIIGTETVGKGVKLAGVGYDKVVDKAMRSLNIPRADSWKFLSFRSSHAPYCLHFRPYINPADSLGWNKPINQRTFE